MKYLAVVLLSLLPPQEPPEPIPAVFLAATIDGAVARIAGFNPAEIAPPCDDSEYLRRVMLDLLGYPPNADEVRAFAADPATDKRSAKVDQLLATDRFADFWARRWRDVLIGNYRSIATEPLKSADPEERDRLMAGFLAWLKGRLAGDLPWSETVKEILEAEGGAAASPVVAYKLAHHEHPRVPHFEGQASRHFLGINLSCTGCHDSAFDKWRVEDGYAMSAFSTGRTIRREKGVLTVSEGPEPDGRPIPGDKGAIPMMRPERQLVRPKFITGGVPKEGEVLARAFARFVVGPENLQFRRAAVNRIWCWLMGRGIVSPVEDFNLKNKPVSKDLLDAMSMEFAARNHSIKFMIRSICRSASYQRRCDGAKPLRGTLWNRTPVRPLSAEQILNSVEVATSGAPRLDLEAARRLSRRLLPPDLAGCETMESSRQIEALSWLGESAEVWSMIRDGAVLKEIRAGGGDPMARTKAMFLAALSREPGASELERYSGFLRQHGEDGLSEAYWTLLQTTEFLMRH